MSFDEEKALMCPRCGKLVPAGNAYCGFCGTQVSRLSPSPTSIELVGGSTPTQQYPPYERKLSMFERITKLLTSPDESMNDIGLAPDYSGVIVLFAVWTILSVIGAMIGLSKMQFVGTYGSQVTFGVMSAVTLAMVFVPVVLIIRWLVKSYLIRYLCGSSSWDFRAAASVTGYAYIPSIVVSFIGLFVTWMFFPSIVIDTTDLEEALLELQSFEAQTLWISIGLNTVLGLIALIWKSYLGSFGADSGTHGKCERGSALGYFLMIGSVGVLIDLVAVFI